MGPREFTLDTGAVRDRLGSTESRPVRSPRRLALHCILGVYTPTTEKGSSASPPASPLPARFPWNRLGGPNSLGFKKGPYPQNLFLHITRGRRKLKCGKTARADLLLTSPSSTARPGGRAGEAHQHLDSTSCRRSRKENCLRSNEFFKAAGSYQINAETRSNSRTHC